MDAFGDVSEGSADSDVGAVGALVLLCGVEDTEGVRLKEFEGGVLGEGLCGFARLELTDNLFAVVFHAGTTRGDDVVIGGEGVEGVEFVDDALDGRGVHVLIGEGGHAFLHLHDVAEAGVNGLDGVSYATRD